MKSSHAQLKPYPTCANRPFNYKSPTSQRRDSTIIWRQADPISGLPNSARASKKGIWLPSGLHLLCDIVGEGLSVTASATAAARTRVVRAAHHVGGAIAATNRGAAAGMVGGMPPMGFNHIAAYETKATIDWRSRGRAQYTCRICRTVNIEYRILHPLM